VKHRPSFLDGQNASTGRAAPMPAITGVPPADFLRKLLMQPCLRHE
jgi:hypothetical protein